MNASVTGILAATERQRVKSATIVQFAVLSMIWGSTWLIIKGQLGDVPVGWSVSYRFLLAGTAILLLSIVLRRSLALPPLAHLVALVVAAMQFAGNFNLVYESEKVLTSGLVSLIFALIVVPNTLLAWFFLRQRIAPMFVVGGVLGIAGVALLVGRDLDLRGSGAAWGLALAAAAVISASIGNVIQASERVRHLPLEPLLAFTMIYGGILAAVYAWAANGPPVFELRPSYAAGLLYLALVASALAFRLYYALIRDIGPARAGYVNVIVPLVAMSLSTVFEGFVWTWSAAFGGVLAMIGLVIALRSRA